MKTFLSIAACLFLQNAFGQGCEPPAQVSVVAHPAGTILPDIGTSDMPVTTNSSKTRQLTRQGFALIHCYWPGEAIRSFRDAVKEDPTCAIAWCGLNIAMTQPWFREEGYKAEAEYAIKTAIANVEAASEPEQALIRAFRLRSFGKDDRDSAFEKAMQQLVDKFPKLDEPRLVWAGIRAQLCSGVNYLKNGDPRGDLEFVVKLVEPVIKRNPNSAGAMHYWIHACEPENPKLAEAAADNLLKVGKGSPHLVHMPGHIYNRIGRYEDGQKAFGRAKQMDEELGRKFNVQPGEADWQYYHNVVFQGMNLLELGRINEAIELSKVAGSLRQDIAARVGDFNNAYSGRRGDETGAAILEAYEARHLLREGKTAAARAKVDLALKPLAKPEPSSWQRTNYRIMRTIVKEAEGLVLSAENKHDLAAEALRDSVKTFQSLEYEEPVLLIQTPYESLGEVLLRGKQYDEAVKAFEAGLIERPNSGWLIYGIGKAHAAAGRTKEAEGAYRRFLKAWATADRDRPEIKAAEDFLASRR